MPRFLIRCFVLSVLLAFMFGAPPRQPESAAAIEPHSFQGPVSLQGTWKWEGVDKKVIVLTQSDQKLTGKIESKTGESRDVEGTVNQDGAVDLVELFPRSAASDLPEAIWKEVLKRREDPQHPGFLRGKIKVSISADGNELTGERVTFTVGWKKATVKFEDVKDESESIKLTRMLGTCGPDVTAQTLTVLKTMAETFENASAEKKSAACDALVKYNVITGEKEAEVAWDIATLFDNSGDYPSTAIPNGSPSLWETLSKSACCVPRYPCGKSVEFFGECHDMQVVNYTMWGMTKVLCTQYLTINAQQWIGDWTRNRRSPNRPDQLLMVDVGERYAKIILPLVKEPGRYGKLKQQYDALRANYSLGRATKQEVERFEASLSATDLKILSSFGTEAHVRDPAHFPELKELVARQQGLSKRETRVCQPNCAEELNAQQEALFKNMKFTFRWSGLNRGIPPR